MSHILLKGINPSSGGTGGGSAYLTGLTDVSIASPLDGQAIVWNSGTSTFINSYAGSGATGISDHGLLSGLLDNDHPQYSLTGHNHTSSDITDFTVAVENQITGVTHDSFSASVITSTTINTQQILFDTSNIPLAPVEGELAWNDDDGTLGLGMPGGNVILQIGQEFLVRVSNRSGVDIPNGSIICNTGSQGNRPTVAMASSNYTGSTSAATQFGMTTEEILDGNSGYVTLIGIVRDLNTSAYPEGTPLFLGMSAGTWTDTAPQAPDHTVWIGVVLNSHISEGAIYFKPTTPMHLSEISDVNGTPPDATNKFLIWDNTNEYWDSGQVDFGDLSNTGHTHSEYIESGTSVEFDSVSANTIYSGGVNISTLFGVGGSGDTTYDRATASYETVGGVTAGVTTFSGTVQEALDKIFYPYQEPTFSSFYINGQSTPLEVGASAATGVVTFLWNATNETNISANTVSILDITNSSTLVFETGNDHTEAYDNGTGITKTTASSHQWRIEAKNTEDTTFLRNYYVYWYWRFYWGSSSDSSATESMIEGLQNDSLYNSRNRTYTCDATNYKWMCWPTSFGQPTSFKDDATGFAVPMESPETVSVTNSFGVTTNYYAYRTTNPVVDSLSIIVA